MNLRCATLVAVAVSALLAGCATSGNEVSKKDRQRMDREMERANRKQAQEQSRMMRDPMRDPMRDRNSGFRR